MSAQQNGKVRSATIGLDDTAHAAGPLATSEVTPAGMAPARAAVARRRSRRGLLIAVMVIALGGVLAFAGASMATRHEQVLAVARNVPQGQVIIDMDLVVASVSADPNLAPIPASDRGQIVGLVAQVPLMKGELLTRAQVGSSSGFVEGQQLVAVPLKPGQLPARGVAVGDHVLLVATPGTTNSETSAALPVPLAAVVLDVGATDAASGVTVVDVRVAAVDGPGLARLVSTGDVALILLPTAGG